VPELAGEDTYEGMSDSVKEGREGEERPTLGVHVADFLDLKSALEAGGVSGVRTSMSKKTRARAQRRKRTGILSP
jgi:hypothetical protein